MTDVTPPTSGAPAGAVRARNPRGQGERLRDDLLAAALRLMAETGDRQDVSIRGVAKAAGVSATAAYRHFEDRDALIDAACDSCFGEFATYMLERISGIDDPFDRLRAAGHAYLDYARAEHGHYRVLFSNPIMHHQAEDFPTTADPAGSAFQQLVGMIEDCLAAGAEPTTHHDSVYLAFQVWTWMHGIADLFLSHPHLPWPDVDTLVVDVAVALGLDRPAT